MTESACANRRHARSDAVRTALKKNAEHRSVAFRLPSREVSAIAGPNLIPAPTLLLLSTLAPLNPSYPRFVFWPLRRVSHDEVSTEGCPDGRTLTAECRRRGELGRRRLRKRRPGRIVFDTEPAKMRLFGDGGRLDLDSTSPKRTRFLFVMLGVALLCVPDAVRCRNGEFGIVSVNIVDTACLVGIRVKTARSNRMIRNTFFEFPQGCHLLD